MMISLRRTNNSFGDTNISFGKTKYFLWETMKSLQESREIIGSGTQRNNTDNILGCYMLYMRSKIACWTLTRPWQLSHIEYTGGLCYSIFSRTKATLRVEIRDGKNGNRNPLFMCFIIITYFCDSTLWLF